MVAKARSGGGGMDWELGLAVANYYIYRIDEQQGPAVEHRELYSISYDKPSWTRI